ncbi:MAG: SDR family NAD(P)-dependent oxidoreductase [Chloroflexota bacterium]|nr:SDR family NAD(P)-dependent oxidoreductase [Chloroflexota bacterium]
MRTKETKAITHIRTQDGASDTSMKGKTVLFTGASRGMGHEAASELARRGAEILVVGHNAARGAAAVDAIHGIGGSAEFLRADMGDAEDVCALAEVVLARGGSIDVLIHSAGGMPPSAVRTREGVDRGFAQNFLGAFLLTRLLEERLLASAPARVIAVGSAAHKLLKTVDIDAIMQPGKPPTSRYQMGNYQMLSYQIAKLAVTTWIYGLARRWAGRGVTANVLDPGMVKGEIGEHFEAPAPMRVMMNHVMPFFVAVGTERGSEQYVRLAADPTLVHVSGMYFVSGKEKREGSSPLSLDPIVQKSISDAAEAWAAPFLRGRV